VPRFTVVHQIKASRSWVIAGSVALAVSFAAAPAVASADPGPDRITLRDSVPPAQERAHPLGEIPATSWVSFDLALKLRNAAGASRYVREVSSPGSAHFHHYLSDAQWVSRFGPTKASAAAARHWLRRAGFTVGQVSRARLYITASASARTVEHAFDVQLRSYRVNGRTVRLASGALSIPASMRGIVSGVVGVNQYLATTYLASQSQAIAASRPAAAEPPPPPGFRIPQPCSAFWGQKTDTKDAASLYQPFTAPLRDGFIVSLRTYYYQGPETYCDGTGNCATRNVTLSTAPGFDSMTGLGSAGPCFIRTLSRY
jgi:Pro-kumamolisin, activation domain